jgi:DNA repair protein RadD
MQLRDYQIDAVNSVYEYFAGGNKGNPLVVLPTGSGKSVVIAELIRSAMAMDKDQRFIMATHVKELIAQNHEKLMTLWHNAPAGIYSAGLGKKQAHQPIIFGGIQSMRDKAEIFGYRNVIIVDECHLLPNKAEGGYHTFLNGLKKNNPNIKVIGLTATPYRMAGGHLLNGEIFTDICFEYPILKLIERGYISPVYTKSPTAEQVDLSNVRTVAGEYNQREMQNAFMADCVTERALDDVFKRATQHKSFLFFCAGVEHAQHTHKLLQSRGLKGAVVYDKTPANEREKAIQRLRNGTYDYLCNNAVLTTGTDIPRIDCVVLLRSTKSRGLYVQMVGRGMRLFEGKTHCLLLDYGGNVDRFGAIDNQPQGKKALTDSGEAGTAPFKRCIADNLEPSWEGCEEINHAKATHCIKCGAPFVQKTPHGDIAAQGNIINKPIEVKLGIHPSHIFFEHHIKRDNGNETMRIDYHWGVALYCSEWLGLARASKRLKQWFPNGEHLKATSVTELIAIAKEHAILPETVYIKKQPDSKYYEVLYYDFTPR